MATLVATTDPTTGTIRIDVNQNLVRDQFTRVVAGGWGNATTGQGWANAGGIAADFSVNGTQGVMRHTAVNTLHRVNILTTAGADNENLFTVFNVPLATGAAIQIDAAVRFFDGGNLYFARLSLNPSQAATIQLRKMVLGVDSAVGPAVTLAALHLAGADWNMKASICGTTLKGKAWRGGMTEPDWVTTASDFDLTTGDNTGIRTLLAVGNTNALPLNFTFDNYAAYTGNPLRLYRVTPDGVRTQVQGSPFFTEQPDSGSTSGQAVLYDSEAPFDVPVFYVITSNCASVVEVTSNTVTLDSGGMAWLRDPVDPTLNFAIDVNGDQFDYCDEDVTSVTFAGLDSYDYPVASGIFDTVNTQRVQNVSMVRKRYAQALTLISKWLDPDFDQVEAILASGRTLLLSLPAAYGFGRGTNSQDYIAISDTRASYVGVDQRLETRVWAIPFRLGYAEPFPTGGTGGNGVGGGGATYEALAASVLGTTYATLTASGQTYLQVAQGVGY